jgi:enoyl-CoA hydratase/carnithine racemase
MPPGHSRLKLAGPPDSQAVVVSSSKNGVALIRFNRPQKYNAWAPEMMREMKAALLRAAADEAITSAILTGTGTYYCAGVDFSSQLGLTLPSTLREVAEQDNYDLFDAFITFPKPLFAAVNGPAIGAAVTSATLCDAIVASDTATFHTPFRALGITPEGCSSFHFPRLIGEKGAKLMLEEGKKLTATEAFELGLASEVVEGGSDKLIERAQAVAEAWVAAAQPRKCVNLIGTLQKVNRSESKALAASFFTHAFFKSQYEFAKARNKTGAMWAFWAAGKLQPVLARL